jgi:YVTN family beta-propeller protein
VAVNPTGTDVYVANYVSNTVSVINPATNSVITTINLGGGTNPTAVAVNPTGTYAGDVYVANNEDGTVSVINPATNTVTATINVGSNNAEGVAVSPSGTDVYVPNGDSTHGVGTVSVIDPSTNMVIATATVGGEPEAVAVSPTGTYAGDVYVANWASGTVSVIS